MQGNKSSGHGEERSAHILLAEDDPVNSIYIRNLLKNQGYHVDLAETGHEVLQMWRQDGPYDLILMDVQMPDMSGIEATTEIRTEENVEGREPIPIIALTAYLGGAEKEEMFIAGVSDYIAKPIKIDRLMRIIEQAGEPGREERETEDPSSDPAPPPAQSDEENYELLLLETFCDAEDTLCEMLEMSISELPERLRAIEEGISSGQSRKAAENCHALANVTGILKAERLRDEALELETSLRSSRVEEARELFSRVERMTDSLIETFRRILKKISENSKS